MTQWPEGELGPFGQAAVGRVGASLGAHAPGASLNGLVHPVVELGPYLKQLWVEEQEEVDPLATGRFPIAIPPVGEIWYVHSVYVAKDSGTSLDFNQLRLTHAYGLAVDVRLMTQTAASALLWSPTTPLPLDAAHYLQVEIANYTAGDELFSAVYVERLACETPVVVQ